MVPIYRGMRLVLSLKAVKRLLRLAQTSVECTVCDTDITEHEIFCSYCAVDRAIELGDQRYEEGRADEAALHED